MIPLPCEAIKSDGAVCSLPCSVICEFSVDGGDRTIRVCKTHMLRLSQVIDRMIQNTIVPEKV